MEILLTEPEVWMEYWPRANAFKIGYHWINGRFGPPPGIDRAEKEQLGEDFCQKISPLTHCEKNRVCRIGSLSLIRCKVTPNLTTILSGFQTLTKQFWLSSFFFSDSLDRTSHNEYLWSVMAMSNEKKYCLMVSEAERLRSFKHWPGNELGINPDLAAATGLFFTG